MSPFPCFYDTPFCTKVHENLFQNSKMNLVTINMITNSKLFACFCPTPLVFFFFFLLCVPMININICFSFFQDKVNMKFVLSFEIDGETLTDMEEIESLKISN